MSKKDSTVTKKTKLCKVKKICSNCKNEPTQKEIYAGSICKMTPTPKDDASGCCSEFKIDLSKTKYVLGEQRGVCLMGVMR